MLVPGKCRLAEILKRKKITQKDLADKLGVPEQQINKYVNNRQGMSIRVAINISIFLNCSIEDLYEWEEKE